MANNRVIRKKMADRLVRMGQKALNRNLKNLEGDEMEAELRKMFTKDFEDTKKIAKLIRANRVDAAWKATVDMDTGARDEMSGSVYDWLRNETY